MTDASDRSDGSDVRSEADDPLLVAINSARVCIERFRVRPESTDLLSTALRELDDAMDLLPAYERRVASDEERASDITAPTSAEP